MQTGFDAAVLANPVLKGADLYLAPSPHVAACEALIAFSPPDLVRRCKTMVEASAGSDWFASMSQWLDVSRAFQFHETSIGKAFLDMYLLPEGNPTKHVTLSNVLSLIPIWRNEWPWALLFSIGFILTVVMIVYYFLCMLSSDFYKKHGWKPRLSWIVVLCLAAYSHLMIVVFGSLAASTMGQAASEEFTTEAQKSVAEANAIIQFGHHGITETGVRMVHVGNSWGAYNKVQSDTQSYIDVSDKFGTFNPYDGVYFSTDPLLHPDPAAPSYTTTLEMEEMRMPYDKKYDWSNLAAQFGRRSYWDLVLHTAHISTDEFRGKHSDYVGYPITCEMRDYGDHGCGYVQMAGDVDELHIQPDSRLQNDPRSLRYLYGATHRSQSTFRPTQGFSQEAELCFHSLLEMKVGALLFEGTPMETTLNIVDVLIDLCFNPDDIINFGLSLLGELLAADPITHAKLEPFTTTTQSPTIDPMLSEEHFEQIAERVMELPIEQLHGLTIGQLVNSDEEAIQNMARKMAVLYSPRIKEEMAREEEGRSATPEGRHFIHDELKNQFYSQGQIVTTATRLIPQVLLEVVAEVVGQLLGNALVDVKIPIIVEVAGMGELEVNILIYVGMNQLFKSNSAAMKQSTGFRHPTQLTGATIDPHYQRNLWEDVLGGRNLNARSPIFDILSHTIDYERKHNPRAMVEEIQVLPMLINDIQTMCRENNNQTAGITETGADNAIMIGRVEYAWCLSTFGQDCGSLPSVIEFHHFNEDAKTFKNGVVGYKDGSNPDGTVGLFGDKRRDGRSNSDHYRKPFTSNAESISICELIEAERPRSKDGNVWTVDNWAQFFRGAPSRDKVGEVNSRALYKPAGFYGSPSPGVGPLTSEYATPYFLRGEVITGIDNIAAQGPFLMDNTRANLNYLLQQATEEKQAGDGKLRWPEFYAFIDILANGVWDLNDLAMKMSKMLDWRVGEGDASVPNTSGKQMEKSWLTVLIYTAYVLFAVSFSLTFLYGLLCTVGWLFVGALKKKASAHKAVRVALHVNFWLQAVFGLIMLFLSCTIIFLLVEITAFTEFDQVSLMLLAEKPLPDLVEDLLPGNQIGKCIFGAQEIFDTRYEYPNLHLTRLAQIPDAVHSSSGRSLDYNAYGVPNLSGQAFSLRAGPVVIDHAPNPDHRSLEDIFKWSTTASTIAEIAVDLGAARDDMSVVLENDLEDLAIVNVRGVHKPHGAESFQLAGRGPFDSMMSSLVAPELILVSLADTGAVHPIPDEAQELVSRHLAAAKEEASYAAGVQRNVLVASDLGARCGADASVHDRVCKTNGGQKTRNLIFRVGQLLPDRPAGMIDLRSDFAQKLNYQQDWTEQYHGQRPLAYLTEDQKEVLHGLYIEASDIMGGPRLSARVLENFATAELNLTESKTALPWENAAHAYLERFYGGADQLAKPIEERAATMCSAGADWTQLADICVTAFRSLPFEGPEGFADMEDGDEKDALYSRKVFEVPVAGYCALVENSPRSYNTASGWANRQCIDLTKSDKENVGKYACIRPMTIQQSNGDTHGLLGFVAQMMPAAEDLINQVWDFVWNTSTNQENLIKSRASPLLPFDWKDNWGRDPKFYDPLFLLTAARDSLTTVGGAFDEARHFDALGVHDLTSKWTARVLHSQSAAPSLRKALSHAKSLFSYRSCIMGDEDARFPVARRQPDASSGLLPAAPGFSTDPIDLMSESHINMMEFMATIEQIQRYSSITQTRSAIILRNTAIAGVEKMFKRRDIRSLPDPEALLKTTEELDAEWLAAYERYTLPSGLLNEVAECPKATAALKGAADLITAGALGHLSKIGWCLFFMACTWFVYGFVVFVQLLDMKARSNEHDAEFLCEIGTEKSGASSTSSMDSSSSSDHERVVVHVSKASTSSSDTTTLLTVHSSPRSDSLVAADVVSSSSSSASRHI